MKPSKKKSGYKKIALALSMCAIIIWCILGAGASIAWFTDTSPELNNIFHFEDFKLELSHRLTDGTWEKVDNQTKIFNEEALYEPGYVQVVYLKVENKGNKPFEFYTAVNVNDCTVATNVYGQQFSLQDYLRFGVIFTDTEENMKNSIPDRETAVEIADMKLHNYSTDTAVLEAGKTEYIALIVRMPQDADNFANHNGKTIPKVELGITAKATQIGKN